MTIRIITNGEVFKVQRKRRFGWDTLKEAYGRYSFESDDWIFFAEVEFKSRKDAVSKVRELFGLHANIIREWRPA